MVLSNAKHSISINLYSTYNVLIYLIKRCEEKFFRIYTKTFGGKTWTNLHRVSPENNLGKNFNRVQLEIFYQIFYEQHLVQFFFLFLTISRFALVSFDRNFKLVLFFFLARDVVNITFTIISNMASYTQSASQKNFISKPKQSITLTFFLHF